MNPKETIDQATAMRAGLILLKSEVETIVKMQALIMKIKRAAYMEAIGQGFTEDQALQLAKSAI